MKNGKFIISLDLELMWGVLDLETIDSYGDAIIGTRKVLNKMLICFDKYNVSATFATVGFLFHKTKKQLLQNLPIKKPTYKNEKLSPYKGLENYLGKDEDIDPYHFGESLIKLIKKYNLHEFATHTYCHYYCLEDGQTIIQFEEDLKLSIAVAKNNNVVLKSIVFPRNQYNEDYIKVCKNYGITSYRGTEKSCIYESSKGSKQTLFKRGFRLIDAYINITGYNCYNTDIIRQSIPYNMPSSRLLRPYSKKLHYLEWLKLLRIKNAMTYAAKNKLVYHLWWHPHNFGRNCKENMILLENILEHYNYLNNKYCFQSITMSELSKELNTN
tara:strand:+ start:1049 stop:2029 length:981 start_codon:yes stop_codon:yes gene_type:complete